MAGDADRLQAALTTMIRQIMGGSLIRSVDYLAAYPCKVISQNSDGTLELQPDDSRLPGLSGVPIRYGIPGVSAKVNAGSRVFLEFSGGDPQSPYAEIWESSSVSQINITGTTVNIDTGGSGTVNIGSSTVSVNLGSALALIARMGDPVVAGPFAGSVLVPVGNTNVKA